MTKKTCVRTAEVAEDSFRLKGAARDEAECPQCHSVVRAALDHEATKRLKESGAKGRVVVRLHQHLWQPRY